jgi:regulator of protease activity HflC (stomatin/prohibitin superfamily)
MAYFQIGLLILLALALVALLLAGENGLAVLAGLGLALVLAFSSLTHVSSNEVGIVNNFGSYQGTVGSGVHWVAPWSSTEKFSTRLQTMKIDNSGITLKADQPGVAGSPAEIDLNVRYQIDGTEHAEKMWRKFKTFDRVTDELVEPEAKSSARQVLGFYTPADATAGKNVRPIGSAIASDLNKALSSYGIVIDSVTVRSVALPKEVRDRLSAIQESAANAQKADVDAKSRLNVARQEKATAEQQAAADKLRRATATRETLVQDCLRVAEKLGKPMDCNYYKQNDLVPAR